MKKIFLFLLIILSIICCKMCSGYSDKPWSLRGKYMYEFASAISGIIASLSCIVFFAAIIKSL